MKRASVAVIEAGDGRVLLLQRVGGRFPGWTLPGGKCEDGEDAATAVRREVVEETGLEVLDVESLNFRALVVGAAGILYEVTAWRVVAQGAVVLSEEHVAAMWMTPSEALARDDVAADSTRDVLKKFMAYGALALQPALVWRELPKVMKRLSVKRIGIIPNLEKAQRIVPVLCDALGFGPGHFRHAVMGDRDCYTFAVERGQVLPVLECSGDGTSWHAVDVSHGQGELHVSLPSTSVTHVRRTVAVEHVENCWQLARVDAVVRQLFGFADFQTSSREANAAELTLSYNLLFQERFECLRGEFEYSLGEEWHQAGGTVSYWDLRCPHWGGVTDYGQELTIKLPNRPGLRLRRTWEV